MQQNPEVQQGPIADPLATNTVSESPVTAPAVIMPQTGNAMLPAVILTSITKPGSLIDLSQLPQDELEQVDRLSSTIMLENQESVTMFGFEMQKEYSDGLSSLLGQSTLGQTGLCDFIAAELKLSTDIVQEAMDRLAEKPGDVGVLRKFARSLPFVGGHVKTAEVLIESRKKLTEIFDNLERKIHEKMRTLIEGETKIDILRDSVKVHVLLLRRHILAGEKALLRMHTQYRAEVQALPPNPDPMRIAELTRFKNLLIGFEVRLVGLRNAYVKAATLLPAQFQGMEEASQIVMQNLRDTMTITIPDLKMSAVQLVTLSNIQEGSEQNKSVREQQAIAEQQAQKLLGQTLTAAKQQQGEVLNDAERLQKLMKDMVDLNKLVEGIDQQNAKKRKQADELLIESKKAFDDATQETARRFIELSSQ